MSIAQQMKIAISDMKKSESIQQIANKYWILIVNLQYDDVKRLCQTDEMKYWRNIDVVHASLPVNMLIYEKAV